MRKLKRRQGKRAGINLTVYPSDTLIDITELINKAITETLAGTEYEGDCISLLIATYKHTAPGIMVEDFEDIHDRLLELADTSIQYYVQALPAADPECF